MKLAIIAGGKGTRLGFDDIPKPMVRIGSKPILELQVELAAAYGIREIYILSGHLSESIVSYFGDGKPWNVEIRHIVEARPLGTAGAVKQLENMISEPFLVFYGDTIMDVNLEKFMAFGRSEPNMATLFVHPNDHPNDSDLVESDDRNRITRFHPKPHDGEQYYFNLVNAALYMMSPDVFRHIPADVPSDFGKDIFPALLKQNEVLLAYKSAEYIKDMGTRQRLEKTTSDYLSGKIASLNSRFKRAALFLDRDGVINREVGNLSRIGDFELLPGTAGAIKKINRSNLLSIVITNQPVVAKGMCSLADLNEIHKKLDTLLGLENAYIDHLYFCPHHPDRGFAGEVPELKMECNCRKPATGMIEKAVKDYNIDPENSFFIGDSTTDLETARRAGIPSILLRTGHMGKDGKYPAKADFVFDDLPAAAGFCTDVFPACTALAEGMIREHDARLATGPTAVITIAGLSRSGKSTFARCMALILKKKGFNPKILNLDNWILGLEDRTESMTVRERYNYARIVSDLQELFSANEILVDEYDPGLRGVTGNKQPFTLEPGVVLIIEGVVALDMEYLREISLLRIFMETGEESRKNKFLNFYLQKGLSLPEAESLYMKRQSDENALIEPTRQFAQFTVNLEKL